MPAFHHRQVETIGHGWSADARIDAADWLISHQRWRLQAACLGMDQAIFYPEKGHKGSTGSTGGTRSGKQVCMTCPVRAQCLEWALQAEELHGIFGGKSPRERRKLRAERRQRAA